MRPVEFVEALVAGPSKPIPLKSNYLDIVTREEAGNFWAINPQKIDRWYRPSGPLCSNTSLGMGAIANCEVYSTNLNILIRG